MFSCLVFSGGRTTRQGGLELPSTWFYGLGAVTALLWCSFSLTCKMRGLSWWSWTPILFSSFSSSVFFSIFPINPPVIPELEFTLALEAEGSKVSSPTQVSPGYLFSLLPWSTHSPQSIPETLMTSWLLRPRADYHNKGTHLLTEPFCFGLWTAELGILPTQ